LRSLNNNLLAFGVTVLMCCVPLSCHQGRQRLTGQKTNQIQHLVKAEIDEGNFPGAVVLIGQGHRILFCEAFGNRAIEPEAQPMAKDNVFDLASLTKPLATAASVMVLFDQSKIDPNDLVTKYLPAFACEGKDTVQVRHLLTHTSGLPAYTGAAALKDTHGSPCPDAVIEAICRSKPLSEPGEQFRYSCLGYILLARIVEVVSGQPLDEFARVHLFEPLGLAHTQFNPPDAWHDRVVPTEIVDDRPLCGTVHDPLAQLMGGVSGNAGLFSTASDMAVLCCMFLNRGTLNHKKILSQEAVSLMTTPQLQGRGFGFDVHSSYAWIRGQYASEESFCHSGYTGTSIVCDPQSGLYVIILTNRAHPHDKGTVKALRMGIADIAFQSR
jgi:CubicO group peptidase (beta-lactamase class C family)